MTTLRRLTVLAAIAGMTMLAGCGNRTDQGIALRYLAKGGFSKTAQGTAMTPEQVAVAAKTTLAQTDLPLVLVVIESRGATAILANIETNGMYRTWGTSDRRTITTAGGFVTATRGMGNDLMSSSVSGVQGLVRQRKPGSGRHVMRFLDGENKTVEVAAQCQVVRGGQKHVNGGAIGTVRTTEMIEACSADGWEFTNRFFVDSAGRTVQSRQWLGEANGFVSMQILR